MRAIASLAVVAFLAAPAAAQNPIPDLSGKWGRNSVYFESPSSGPGPIISKLWRMVPFEKNVLGTIQLLVEELGLRPQAAEAVKKNLETTSSGVAGPTPRDQCRPEPTPFILSQQNGVQIIQKKDETVLLHSYDHKVRHVRMNVPHSAHVARPLGRASLSAIMRATRW